MDTNECVYRLPGGYCTRIKQPCQRIESPQSKEKVSMYISPISLIEDFKWDEPNNLGDELDNTILKAIYEVGIKVNKEEIIKALQYDHNQYEKGYEDGKNDSVRHGHWVSSDGSIVNWDEMNPGCPERSCYCSVCGDWLTASDEYPCTGLYCPNCGAKMDEKEN